ncbi:hypothetical protein C8R47DRAFT_1076573 [Mycena vitilis]|nr:hypothetical protein C8R47DRAFT_1076573 [Mycena vitilis]
MDWDEEEGSEDMHFLASYLCSAHAPYVTKDRGLTSIGENIYQDPQLNTPATITRIELLSPLAFSHETCDSLQRYYRDLQDSGSPPLFFDLTVSDVFYELLRSLTHLCFDLAYLPRPSAGTGREPSTREGSVWHWKDITVTAVRASRPNETSSPTTSEDTQARRSKCHIQSFVFARAVQEIHSPLIPLTLPLPSTAVVLYHATREKCLLNFRRHGIDPGRNGRPYCSSSTALFNLADSAEAAVAHVLHGNPTVRNPSTGAVTDPVMVLAFQLRLDTMIHKILSDKDAPGEPANDISAEVVHQKRGWNKFSTDHDFVIRPSLISLQGKRYEIADAWTAAGKTPTHVAAVSLNAFKLLEKSLIAMYAAPDISAISVPRRTLSTKFLNQPAWFELEPARRSARSNATEAF